MTEKITGVFVKLPLDEAQIMKLYDPKRSGNENLIAIGTPVPGWVMPVTTTLGTLRDPVPCVRQADALAKLAEKDAEIARLREALAKCRVYHVEHAKTLSEWPQTFDVAYRRAEHNVHIETIDAALSGGFKQ